MPSFGSMAYDSARRVCVLVLWSYYNSNGIETHEWDGTRWRVRSLSGPTSIGMPGPMCYDSVRRRTVLFNEQVGETWEWDGAQWQQIDIAGPSPRYASGMVYDSARSVCVLFGGAFAGEDYDQTWEYDGQVWTQRDVAAPPPRRVGKAMAYDSDRHVVVLYGGSAGDWNSDTWEYDGQAWVLRDPKFASNTGNTLVYDPVRKVTVSWGGDSGPGYVVWSGTQWSSAGAVTFAGPLPFYSYDNTTTAMAHDSHRERIVAFGGAGWFLGDDFTFNSTFELSSDNVLTVVDASPLAHGYPAMAFDSIRNRAVLIDEHQPGRVWEYDGAAEGWHFLHPGDGPIGRPGAKAVFDSARGVTVLFGGSAGSGAPPVNELWEWHGQAWTERLEPGPSGRTSHAMAYDSKRATTVVFGGWGGSPPTHINQTWEWNGTEWSLRATTGPSPRSDASMAFDPIRNVTVLFGGGDSSAPLLNDTWEWDGAEWTLAATTGPSPRRAHAMTFDASRGRVALYGGYVAYGSSGGGVTTNREHWEWNGKSWTQLPNGPFTGQPYAALLYDPQRERVISYGGGGSYPYSSSLWEFGNDLHFTAHPFPQRVLAGQNAIFSAAAESASAFTFQWRKGGVPIADATKPQLLIANVSREHVGEYDVIIANACGTLTSPPAALTIGTACAEDIFPPGGSGGIDVNDLLAVLGAWGQCPAPPLTCPADINGDGTVNASDLDLLIAAWGTCVN